MLRLTSGSRLVSVNLPRHPSPSLPHWLPPPPPQEAPPERPPTAASPGAAPGVTPEGSWAASALVPVWGG